MDTREKIKKSDELPALLASGNWNVVAGYFDPLTLEQAQRLRNLSGEKQLLAVVLSGETPLLSARARAELVAALASVNAVVISENDEWLESIPKDERITVMDDRASDLRRTEAFIQFVVERQRSAPSTNAPRN